MKWILGAGAALIVLPASAGAERRPMLHDPIALNIGVNCQWQQRCMSKQRAAMKRALSYVEKYKPPRWRVQLCNRNAGRGGYRVDWIGYENCIRNTALRASPGKRMKR
ncbi:MAG: hypothetical protein ACJ8EH_08400 [Sphingomicrobium sp.]